MKFIKSTSKNNGAGKSQNDNKKDLLLNLNKSNETTGSSNTNSTNNDSSTHPNAKAPPNTSVSTSVNIITESNEQKVNKLTSLEAKKNESAPGAFKKASNQRNAVEKSLKASVVAKNNHSFASTLSRDDEFSSSYDSHSDYDNSRKAASTQTNIAKLKNVKSSIFVVNRKASKTVLVDVKPSCKDLTAYVLHQQYLQPRPESLAVMTHDQFAERCASAKQSSTNLNNKSSPVNAIAPTIMPQKIQIASPLKYHL